MSEYREESGACEDLDDFEWGNEVSLSGPGAFVGWADRSGDRFSCYVLVSSTGKSRYVGMTCDLPRRLRQHNKEIRGGARATSRGGPWKYAAVISGFADHHEALTAEWRLKRLGRSGRGPVAVLAGLSEVLTSCLNSGADFRSWTSSSRYDFRASGLCLHVLGQLAVLAPGLVGAAEGVGWVCRTVDSIAPLEVQRDMPVSLFRPESPSRTPVPRIRPKSTNGKKKRWHS
jgi:predicted GIY-YIG superfamily endonuclease